ncbi:hypothetical protein KY092_16945 [Natronomonas gomsonensis]|nr:hypothetical protein [Natronomonas gomsonensis]MCY4732243.1 hypothetical protein [Natronomonas gomsonensis]
MTDSGPRKQRGRTKAWLYLALFGSDSEGGVADEESDASGESTEGGR